MRIGFWSNDSQSGTTSGMLAIAAMTSLLYPDVQVSVKRLRSGSATSVKIKACLSKREQEICFLDCGTGFSGDKLQLLEQMDLVVVSVKQDAQRLDRFFMEDRLLLPDTLLLLGDYYGDFFAGRCYLEHRYRLTSQQFGVIFHNGAFGYAVCRRRIAQFVRKEYQKPQSMENERMIFELERFTRCMINHCTEKRKGGNQIWNR